MTFLVKYELSKHSYTIHFVCTKLIVAIAKMASFKEIIDSVMEDSSDITLSPTKAELFKNKFAALIQSCAHREGNVYMFKKY